MTEFIFSRLASLFTISIVRYLLFAGIAYLIFYIFKRSKFWHLKIQDKYPETSSIKHEIGYSLLSMFVFAIIGVVVAILNKFGYTQIYTTFSDHSVGYFLFTIVFLILLHDTYFYWMHRAIHHKKVYRKVHKTHHISTNPTPLAAFSFHPLEAVAEVAILPIFVFLLPLHPLAILAWVLFMTSMNVLGHLGFELFPSGFTTNRFTKLANTSMHHNMHHKYVNCNYGLYFNFWDRLMGTNHVNYDAEFEKVIEKRTPHNIGKEHNYLS
jgi:lathosterol oxidase